MPASVFLPMDLAQVLTPPVKCQGIKTRLARFIASQIQWEGQGVWREPFLGSASVLLNLRPPRAVVSDLNPHLIAFYLDLQAGRISPSAVREYLTEQGAELRSKGEDVYYAVREEFNASGGSLRFLFLSRACFNGVMRFNRRGGFNVPFCRKPDRFRPAHVTRIVNQVAAAETVIRHSDWRFAVMDWREALAGAEEGDFVYLDPPYPGRHSSYFAAWSEAEAEALARAARSLPCGYALSMWQENRFRRNLHLEEHWAGLHLVSHSHFYHVGSAERFRHPMREVLAIKPGFAACPVPA